jgi:CBS-domain-containing membrane protein
LKAEDRLRSAEGVIFGIILAILVIAYLIARFVPA